MLKPLSASQNASSTPVGFAGSGFINAMSFAEMAMYRRGRWRSCRTVPANTSQKHRKSVGLAGRINDIPNARIDASHNCGRSQTGFRGHFRFLATQNATFRSQIANLSTACWPDLEPALGFVSMEIDATLVVTSVLFVSRCVLFASRCDLFASRCDTFASRCDRFAYVHQTSQI